MNEVQIVGRRSSLFTRLPLIFAEELAVPYELVPIYDMSELGPDAYAGNPALKLPILRTQDSTLFGAQNICRALAERAGNPAQIVWPEQLNDDLSRNAQELVWHCMAVQVQLVFGTVLCKLPADNLYFTKARAGAEGSLRWLDANLSGLLRTLPPARELSLFETSLFCLIEHFIFRPTLAVEKYESLTRFSREFAAKPSTQRTAYKYDDPAANQN